MLRIALSKTKGLLPKNIITMKDFSFVSISQLFSFASQLEKSNPSEYSDLLSKKIVALLFYQPSTRTYMNFHTAALKLGAHVIGFSDPKTTRAGDFYKESLEDVVRFTEPLCNLLVLRHFENFAAQRAASNIRLPLINAGDGYNEHPTQALGDVWTMNLELGGLEGKTIGLLGDLSVRSLKAIVMTLSKFPIKELLFLLPEDKEIPEVLLNIMKESNTNWRVVSDVETLMIYSDLIETIGINHPNHNLSIDSVNEISPISEKYLINAQLIKKTKPSIPILHPGPRTNEISGDVDSLPNAAYFRQIRNGLFIRMALLACLAGDM